MNENEVAGYADDYLAWADWLFAFAFIAIGAYVLIGGPLLVAEHVFANQSPDFSGLLAASPPWFAAVGAMPFLCLGRAHTLRMKHKRASSGT